MTTTSGSTVVRRQLGRRLRSLREGAHKTIKDVVDARLMSQSTLQRIEAGRTAVKISDVWALCRFYGADSATTDELGGLANGTTEDVWWEEYGDLVVPDWFGLYLGLEEAASQIRAYDQVLVHGLLQTQNYARAVISADARLKPDVVERRVSFRMQRQTAIFNKTPKPKITITLSEGSLMRVVGSRDVIREQLAHLRRLSSQGQVAIRILTWDAGAYPVRGPFTLLDFPDRNDPAVAYVEIPMGARYMEKAEQLEEYAHVWSVMTDKATPIEEYTP